MSLVATWLEAGGRPIYLAAHLRRAFGNLLMPSPRRFRRHGPLKNSAALAFVIKDSRGQKIAYVYYEDELAHENDGSP